MKKRICLLVIILLITFGYLIGHYFVGYALRRGNDANPKAIPAACAAIHDTSAQLPPRPGDEAARRVCPPRLASARSTVQATLCILHFLFYCNFEFKFANIFCHSTEN